MSPLLVKNSLDTSIAVADKETRRISFLCLVTSKQKPIIWVLSSELSRNCSAESTGVALLHILKKSNPSRKLEIFTNNRMLVNYLKLFMFPRTIFSWIHIGENINIQHLIPHTYIDTTALTSIVMHICSYCLYHVNWKAMLIHTQTHKNY